jgi:hypothetical protein
MNIRDVAQRFVATVKPQMDHPKAWLIFISRTDSVVKPQYAYTALATEVTGESTCHHVIRWIVAQWSDNAHRVYTRGTRMG